MAQGSLKLLKQGAHLVTNAEDILHEFSISNLQFSNKIKISKLKLSKEEKKIVSLLESDEMTIDEIAKKLKIDVSKLFISVSNLEIKGLVRNRNGKFALIT
jgi:DNA processing protein